MNKLGSDKAPEYTTHAHKGNYTFNNSPPPYSQSQYSLHLHTYTLSFFNVISY